MIAYLDTTGTFGYLSDVGAFYSKYLFPQREWAKVTVRVKHRTKAEVVSVLAKLPNAFLVDNLAGETQIIYGRHVNLPYRNIYQSTLYESVWQLKQVANEDPLGVLLYEITPAATNYGEPKIRYYKITDEHQCRKLLLTQLIHDLN